MNTIHVEIHTTDQRFPLGREGRRVVEAVENFRTVIKTTGREMVTFTPTVVPSDYPMAVGFAPVEWLV